CSACRRDSMAPRASRSICPWTSLSNRSAHPDRFRSIRVDRSELMAQGKSGLEPGTHLGPRLPAVIVEIESLPRRCGKPESVRKINLAFERNRGAIQIRPVFAFQIHDSAVGGYWRLHDAASF